MLKEERQQLILDKLNADKKVTLVQLGQLLSVSYDSIRRDIIELEDRGLLKKVHGGAIANSYLTMNADQGRGGLANTEFNIITKKALRLIENYRIILMDGGTTNYHIAAQLPKSLEVTIVTNNPHLAVVLAEHPKIDVILLGGTFYKRYQITMGSKTLQDLSQLHVDLYFMGVNGIHPEKGLSIRQFEESILKQKMMSVSTKTVTCLIEEKINSVENYKVCDLEAVGGIITSLSTDHPMLDAFVKKGAILY
jgi:DeoR/GlpR family transcriptional regulator of sugar metabolism